MKSTYKRLRDNVFKEFPNKVFLETGTYLGDSVQLALEAGFEQIISIELSPKYYRLAKDRFKDVSNVFIYWGDSSEILPDILDIIHTPITFWLDGHYSKGDTALGKYCTPLMIELDHISKHRIKNHTILIDDMRCWSKKGTPKCVCDKYPCDNFYGFYTDDIIEKLKEINNRYTFEYRDHDSPNDILVAHEL